MNRCAARRFFDFSLICAFAAIADIVANAVVEQHGVLRNNADGTAQAGLRDIAQILVVDRNPAAGHVVKTVQQPRDGRLARARRTNHRKRVAGLDVETDAFQNLPFGVISEMHIVKHNRPATDRQRRRIWLVRYFRRGVDEFEHRGHIGEALANGAIHHAQHVQRPE